MKKVVEGRKLTKKERETLRDIKNKSDEFNKNIYQDARSYALALIVVCIVIGLLFYIAFTS